MAHTPEPWKILKVDENGYVSSPEGKDLAITAGGIIAEVFYRIDDDIYADVEANARMMANAPGMFNVLKEENRILTYDWDKYDSFVGNDVFRHENYITR